MEAERCQALANELRELLRGADAKWRAFETCLWNAEERAISDHSEDLQRWFGKEVSEQLCGPVSAEGSLKRKIRDRVEKLLLVPLDERIAATCRNVLAALESKGDSHPIDMLLEYWEASIKPALDEASKEDIRICKKLRRLEKVGARVEAKSLEQRRVGLWVPVHEALLALEEPLRALALLLNTELVSDSMHRSVSAVPAIIARSVCDWHYQRCVGEFNQLSCWWESACTALQRRPDVWEKLLEKEGLFVRRIERGIDEIHKEKCRYIALANFGHSGIQTRPGSEWPAESAALLARAVNEMQRRLRPVRDCAAYRIIDAANSIMKAVAEEELSKERSPWEQIGYAEGMASLCRFLDVPEMVPGDLREAPTGFRVAFGEMDPADVVLRLASLLDCLVGGISDLAKLADDMAVPDTGGLSYILEEVLQAILYVQEDLLVVLDEPSEDSLSTWLAKSWGEWCVAGAGDRLDKAMTSMPLKGDSVLSPRARHARRSRLALMRGLQILLDNSRFRVLLLERTACPQDSSASVAANASETVESKSPEVEPLRDVKQAVDFDPLWKTQSHSSAPLSPRSTYVPRKPDIRSESPEIDTDHLPSADQSMGVPPISNFQPLAACLQGMPESSSRLRGSSTPAGQSASKANEVQSLDSIARPPTPSQRANWLDPPWPRPRQEVAFDSWSRPGTPAAGCDEADFLQSPMFKSKLIDGQCVSLRLGSSSKRLPPINSALSGSMRNTWQM